MSCNHPHKAFDTGNLTENGKRLFIVCPGTSGNLLSLDVAEKRHYHILPGAPICSVNGKQYLCDPIPIPCGKCVGCRMEAAKQWKIRVCHEAELFPRDKVFFVTLTYDDRHLPLTRFGQPYINKNDIDRFLDKLARPGCRKRPVNRSFKFFACSEYGENFGRPHFHLILMARWLDDLIPYEFQAYHSQTIADAWPYGLHQVKIAEENMIAYVCGYCEKKQVDPLWDDYPVKPFTMKSRNLGCHKTKGINGSPDRKVYGLFGQHYAAIPRAYLRKLQDEPWMQSYKDRSIVLAKAAQDVQSFQFQTLDEEAIGFAMDQIQVESLEEKRHLIL